jgi:hypothetical protein
MDSINFLKEGLKELYHSLSYLEIKYEYRISISTHIIEVKPVHCYEKDNLYIQQQIALEDKFSELFPYEEILFMSENVLIQIDEPILELGTSKVEVNAPQIIDLSINTELISINFDLTELFNVLSAVNASKTCDTYTKYAQCVSEISEKEFFYQVDEVDISYSSEPPCSNKKTTNKKNNTKKDSDIYQSLFFY